MNTRNRALDLLKNLDVIIASLALTVLIFITFFGVILRYFLGQPLIWQEEVQLMCLVWIVFLASGAAFRYGNHVMIEMVVDMLPAAAAKIVTIIDLFISLGILAFFGIQSTTLISSFLTSGRSTNILDIPYSMIYMAVPVGVVLMMINIVITNIEEIKAINSETDTKGEAV